MTVRDVAFPPVTAARTAPKKTMLFAAIALKFVPLIVTTVPTGPELGEKKVMAGAGGRRFRNTETVLLLLLAVTNSGLPSPSRSPMATPSGVDPVVKSTFEAKELAVIGPEALVFLKTETVLLLLFVITKSGLPFPSTSPIATPVGAAPVVKSTFDANPREPGALKFPNTETVLSIGFTTAKSGLPSPLRSPMATLNGFVPVVKSTFEAKPKEPKEVVFLKTETLVFS